MQSPARKWIDFYFRGWGMGRRGRAGKEKEGEEKGGRKRGREEEKEA